LHTFLQSALQNQHNLFDFPADNFDAHMQHYLRCKRKSPHETSACFLVPSVKGPWTKYLAKFKQLKVYPSGTPLYMDSRTSTPIPSPHQVVAYYDQPVPRLHLNAFADDTQHLHMTFPCTIAGQTVDIMVDTGASHSFMDAGFARQNGIHIDNDVGSVNCGGNNVASVVGSAYLQLRIENFRQRVKFYLTDLPAGHSVILGNTWLVDNQAVLDHSATQKNMQIFSGNKKYIFLCPAARSSSWGGQPTAMIRLL
jgi:hypothetical protein